MPELPEVESARQVIDRFALGRRIVDVDDADTYVCRPHRPGEIRAALVGRRLTSVHRRGKSMWCETSGLGRSRTPGPVLGIHLGMSGRIVAGDGRGGEVDGGDYWARGREPGDHRYARFSITFADGGYLMLVDPSLSTVEVDRLHRAVLEAVASAIGSGGVHNLPIVAARRPDARCPRCDAPMARARVGGRTTWWCTREQV